MSDFAAKLAKAKLPEKVVHLPLNGDLVAEHEELDRQLEALLKSGQSAKFGGDGRGQLAERIKAIEEQMRESEVAFRFRAMPRKEWTEFCAEHPPRKTESGEVDERDGLGVNTETFWPALIRRSLVDPTPSDEQWDHLMGVITDRQYRKLADTAWSLNRRDVDVPFSSAVYAMNRTTEPE